MRARTLRRNGEASFEVLAKLTARVASTARLDPIAEMAAGEIAALGFGMVWLARLDRSTGRLLTIVELADGVDVTDKTPEVVLDRRRPIGHGFRQRRMINVRDPNALFILDEDTEPVPPGVLALSRGMYRHLGGSPFACGPLLGSDGTPVGALGLCSYRGREPIPDDVLERGLLRAFRDHLGIATERAIHLARLESMTADLLKVQDVDSRDARLKAVGELAAAVAHDLNHLSGIALMAVSAGMRSPDAALDALQPIERASRTIGDLVARLQRVARAGASAGDASIANPGELVQDILLMMAPVLREQSIAVELDAGPVPAVAADPAIVHQVVLNLVLNARDALGGVPPDRRALRIRVRDEQPGVRIVVADTGPGVAPDGWARMFQPFVTTKGSSHLGLGLAAARAALERIGGELTGDTAPGGGAVFQVTLARAARRAASGTPPPRPEGEQLTAARPGAEVLVIDDDRDLVNVIGSFLAPLGYRVTPATSAAQALALAAVRTFDLVLCDVGLPQQSGPEVRAELRQSGFTGRIILMTGWDDHQLAAEQPGAEYDQLLRKPFFGADLIRAIESSLGDRSRGPGLG